MSFPIFMFGQLDSLTENEFLAFPNWQIGDKKMITTVNDEITITNGDTIIHSSTNENILTIQNKNEKLYFILLQDLSMDSLRYEELLTDEESEVDSSEEDLIIEKLLFSTMNHILNNLNEKLGIQYKIDKWGYYKGLNQVVDKDYLENLLIVEINQNKQFNFLTEFEVEELVSLLGIENIEEIISQSFFEDIRVFYAPYDLRLSTVEPLIDTSSYMIPWFTNPINCEKKVELVEDLDDIVIKISYNYLLEDKDYLIENNPQSLTHFNLNLKSEYKLDYKSKWIKSFTSETITEENEIVKIEKSNVKFEDIE